MSAPVVVTGGTGTLGRIVVERLLDDGHDVRILSRRAPATGPAHQRPAAEHRPAEHPPAQHRPAEHRAIDLRTGAGLDDAIDGADTIVHCASSQKGDLDAARHLLAAARQAGVRHLVYISIVGVDRIPIGYYGTKLAVEREVEAGGVGWTILRTTQFHDLILRFWTAQRRLPVLLAPGFSFQPIEVREVAARLVELSVAAPAGRVPDMGGPQVRPARDLARAYLRATGSRRATVPVRLAGKTFAAFRAGGHLTPEHAVGQVTFDEFLAAR